MNLEKHPREVRAFHQAERGIGIVTIGDERDTATQGDHPRFLT